MVDQFLELGTMVLIKIVEDPEATTTTTPTLLTGVEIKFRQAEVKIRGAMWRQTEMMTRRQTMDVMILGITTLLTKLDPQIGTTMIGETPRETIPRMTLVTTTPHPAEVEITGIAGTAILVETLATMRLAILLLGML